jgi:cytochrome c peroxidase
MHTRRYTFLAVALAGLACLLLAAASSAQALTAKEKVGKSLFFDTNLSEPAGQACAACHAGNVGWTGPDASVNQTGAVYPGALAPRFGNRKPPSAAYAGSSPNLHYVNSTTGLVGGMFWDGRKTGFVLGDPLTEQAQGPFLNPLEQNNASAQVVVDKVAASSYAPQFKAVWGAYIFSDTDAAYYAIAQSIATFERSPQVSAFASKYDAYRAGRAHFTAQEKQGMKLFNDKANCSGCHVPPLFTDYSYDDLGVPKNPLNPFYGEADFNPAGAAWVDEGLGGYLKGSGFYDASISTPELGKFKVPTLRNVDKRPSPSFVKAYGHNGYFKSLAEIVHFYNTRDVAGAGWKGVPWPAPEYAANINTTQIGDLGLTATQEKAVVAFLKTLTDR